MTDDGRARRKDVRAAGEKSIAAMDLSGVAATGDNPYIDARHIHFGTGVLIGPTDVNGPAGGGHHNLPRRVDHAPFVGRDDDLAALTRVLESGPGVIAQAIAGLGGIGKTELALRHAWAHRDRYRLVWWVTADTPANIEAGLAGLARRLHPPLQHATTSAEAAEWAAGWLQAHPGGLLVLDNVENPADVEALVAQLDGTHVLVTTRRDVDWRRRGLVPMRLGVLDLAAATDLLVELTGDPDRVAAAELAKQLGCLPLAVDQAAAYISEHRTTIAGYRRLLGTDPARVLTTPPEGSPTDRAVARVWNLTRQAIDRRSPLAVRLLDILAWLGPDQLPRDLVDPISEDPASVADALALLASYSVIILTGSSLSVHRLVQAITRLNPPAAGTEDGGPVDLPPPADEAARLLAMAIPSEPETNVRGWRRWQGLLSHIDVLAELTPDRQAGDDLSYLLDRAAAFQQGQGQYPRAIDKLIRAANLDRSLHGPDHPNTLTSRHNLARAYRDAGRTTEAIALFEEILADRERLLGPGHPDTLTGRGNLALAYRNAGRTTEAIALLELVLRDF
jgi:tetratricopeptide (TPR) repeat protein